MTPIPFISQIDRSYNVYMNVARDWDLYAPMQFITHLGDPVSLLFISVAILLILWILKKSVHVIQFAGTMVTASLAVFVLKHVITRARPLGIIPEDGYSFPSGHALVSAVFFPLIIYSFKSYIPNRLLRYVFIAMLLVTMILVGWSRLYFGVHYVSDVVGGLLIGGIISAVSILITEAYLIKHKEY